MSYESMYARIECKLVSSKIYTHSVCRTEILFMWATTTIWHTPLTPSYILSALILRIY